MLFKYHKHFSLTKLLTSKYLKTSKDIFSLAGKFDRGQPRPARGPGWRGLPGPGDHRGAALMDRDGLQDHALARLFVTLR